MSTTLCYDSEKKTFHVFRSESNRKSIVSADVIQIETLHHADKQKSEAYILELVLWLNYLVAQSKATSNGGRLRSLLKSPDCSSLDSVDRVNIYQ